MSGNSVMKSWFSLIVLTAVRDKNILPGHHIRISYIYNIILSFRAIRIVFFFFTIKFVVFLILCSKHK